MSILKSTKSGYAYNKWRNEVKWFAIRVLSIVNSGDLKDKENIQIMYKLPISKYTHIPWSFNFKPTITVDEFVEELIKDIECNLVTDFDIVDFVVPYKLYIK
jgi:hypothetical protein